MCITLINIALTLASCIAVGMPMSAAGQISREHVFSVDENSPGGQIVIDLREALALHDGATCRLDTVNDVPFFIDEAQQLVVAEDTTLDHETAAVYPLVIEVARPSKLDPLQARFLGLVKEGDVSSNLADDWRWTHETVTLMVTVTDLPEPPTLLPRIWSATSPSVSPGDEFGAVIAYDPDRQDRLRYQISRGPSWLDIDVQTGHLFLARSVAGSQWLGGRCLVEVHDTHGLQSARWITLPTLLQQRVVSPPPIAWETVDGGAAKLGPQTAARPGPDSLESSDVARSVLHNTGPSALLLALPPTLNELTQHSFERSLDQRPLGHSRGFGDTDVTATREAPEIEESADVIAGEAHPTVDSSVPESPTSISQDVPPAQAVPGSDEVQASHTVLKASSTLAWKLSGLMIGIALVVGTVIIRRRRRRRSDAVAVAEEHIADERRQTDLDTATDTILETGTLDTMPEGENTQRNAEADAEQLAEEIRELFGNHVLDGMVTVSEPGADETLEAGDDRQGARPHTLPAGDAPSTEEPLKVEEWLSELLNKAAVAKDGHGSLSSASQVASATMCQSGSQSELSERDLIALPKTDPRQVKQRVREQARSQIELLRDVARTHHQAVIVPLRRQANRRRWMSAGVTATASTLLGAVCLLTNCFGAISLPCGSLLLIVGVGLLVKQSYFDRQW